MDINQKSQNLKGLDYLYDDAEIGYHNRRFMYLRWVAITGLLLITISSVKIFHFLENETLPNLLGSIAVLAVFNLILGAPLEKLRLSGYTILRFQIYVDLVFLTMFMHFSGGIENPMIVLTSMFVIISGMLLSRRDCYTVAATALGLMMVLGYVEFAGILPHHSLKLIPHETTHGKGLWKPLFMLTQLSLHGFFLFLTAFLTTTLAERGRKHKSSLKTMAEHALEERLLLVQSLLTTQTGLRVVDRDLTHRWQNSLWDQWFSREDAHRVPIGNYLTINDLLDSLDQAVRGTFQHGKILSSDYEFRCSADKISSSGSAGSAVGIQAIRVIIAPLEDSNDQVHQVVLLARDITEEKLVQRRINESGKLAAIGKMAGKIAHEVNNPVSIISGKARILISDRTDEMSEKVLSELSKITDLTDRITRITRNLLSYSRPKKTARNPVNVRIPILVSLENIKQVAAARSIEIIRSLEGDFPQVLAESTELEQVFLNLLMNAMDAVEDGGKIRVSVNTPDHSSRGPAVLEIRLSDNGHGISEKDLETIFEPFYTTKHTGSNTGLGLSICREIIYNIGGTMRVESSMGSGTVFIIQLPVIPD